MTPRSWVDGHHLLRSSTRGRIRRRFMRSGRPAARAATIRGRASRCSAVPS